MAVSSVSVAARNLGAVIDDASRGPVHLTRRGRPVAAVIAVRDLDRLQRLAEDMTDILDAEAARHEMRETGVEPLLWERVRADLGLR
ncbi:type II toxin-antitoxin system prevent-host-death family antitoxin [Modestobacter sp. I12A-02628]|uniref:Antitoxin n=2 Tax=Goekera deserti TaxID=2497753 RepID=A0A7K3WHW4_9ACTN|nr:type II toxin-antitoxin system Phd/YefM family antitoxin [Goekera deserti]MPQ96575.1 type II toxin-antitoxin system prevent-host-death family antitoxin [Goekera deserti]NDI47113.1 type II toxin-antitoxin system prevent-host-death family antitoxin [Goekera deserti]NEL55489.1 type II toxin-antitoxin system Phd/YefM family antitoxin [Goekera deserti]